jgi:TPR repeat protein
MYSEGEGVPQNYVEAAKWMRKAADQGDAGAQNNLGVMYAKGSVKEPDDFNEKVNIFRKAADPKDEEEAFKSFLMTDENKVEAVKWFRKAADQGYAGASFNLGMMSKDEVEARTWLRKAHDQLLPARGDKLSTDLFIEIEAREKAAGK